MGGGELVDLMQLTVHACRCVGVCGLPPRGVSHLLDSTKNIGYPSASQEGGRENRGARIGCREREVACGGGCQPAGHVAVDTGYWIGGMGYST